MAVAEDNADVQDLWHDVWVEQWHWRLSQWATKEAEAVNSSCRSGNSWC